MEQLYVDVFEAAGVDPETASVNEVVLEQGTNRVTVSLSCSVPLTPEAVRSLEHAFSARAPGFLVHVETPDAAASDVPPASPPARPTAVPTVQKQTAAQQASSAVILGTSIKTGKRTPIHDLRESDKTVLICGTAVSYELMESFSKKGSDTQSFRVRINLTDYTDSVYCVCTFYDEAKRQRFFGALDDAVKRGSELLVRGICRMPKYAKELHLFANDVNTVEPNLRQDKAEEKRVELHLHTRMSTMDGLTDVSAAFATAKRFGHKALAVTDHGVVQAYPEAAKASKKTGVQAIFGLEGYLLPDSEPISSDQTYVVFDIETTGLKPASSEIIEIGAVKIAQGQIVDRFASFVNDGAVIPPRITELTRITGDMLIGAPTLREVLTSFDAFCSGCCLVAHNAEFDMGFIRTHGARFGLDFSYPYADTLMLSRYLLHDLPNHRLETVCAHLCVDISGHHRAVDDAAATAQVFLWLLGDLAARGIDTIPVRTNEIAARLAEHGRGAHKSFHIMLLATTQESMKNLYRLVSYAHLDHFRTRPQIPRSLLSIYRSGLLIGTACEQGELYQAVLRGDDDRTLTAIAERYDFFEIQPLANNAFLVRNGSVPDEEALRTINRRIVALGRALELPVVATGDVHFLEPRDSIYRQILMTKLDFADADQQAPLYFKTTDEMLSEFAYLGEDEARRVVIEAPNEIAARCAPLKPFPDGTHAPEIPNANEELRRRAEETAHRIYGDTLPEVVEKRLARELTSIIGNGFASLYLMAQRLVHKSLSDGYIVGSRGSVGSSFVATMAGITEVNPLQPHYVCPACRYSDFDVDRSLYACGVDMPDRLCPVCGAELSKAGFDIPFEVFLGFEGNKTPDIDLNFSGEYQPVAHKYVEEMFGVGHAFRAGTISGLAERKAYECIYTYMEKTGAVLRKAEMERLCKGCLNVKVTTGQHPGGIVIVPRDDDILDYTPIQYPADKKDKNTVTTHFDFHAMDDRLVKLDILGHDDPTALKMLHDLTDVNPLDIRFDDPQTRRIYASSEPLGVDLSALNCSAGTLGVPEFGTTFVRGVLDITLPSTMEELVRIAGLTHGIDVWLNNAEPLVSNKIARISEVICTRDDIMNYLIAHGMEASLSFSIMERVRKGRGLTEDMELAMQNAHIPGWFVDSCKKIKYMFPRGHAVAYAMMSFRIAYYKVHHPLAFYAVYYTVRADAFDVTLASGGPERILSVIRSIERSAQTKDAAERKRDRELQTILEVVYEMNMRGIDLLPIDIYRSKADRFMIEDGAIRPPFTAMPGVGKTAAETLVFEEAQAPYLSIEDFQRRTGANSGVVAALERCGCFSSLPRQNQISLF